MRVTVTSALVFGAMMTAGAALAQDVQTQRLNGVKPDGQIVGETGKFLYPVLVQTADGAIHECSRRLVEMRGRMVRFCHGTNGMKALREQPIVATQSGS